ncbi:MAG: GNAT family N-acetyltransferase [Clostridia bacterium]|nr:GNAT family N-acetyltransferase [Clostridia bacterium]MDE7328396.1 GNAT family N-acetyltransferase [Clostridia bacterium]
MNAQNELKVIFEDFKKDYIDSIYDIENQSLDEAWSKEQLGGLIGCSNAIARVGLVDNKAVCSYSLYIVGEEGFVNNLSVEETFRGKGVGSFLMEDMINCSKLRNLSALTLEVNENNTAAINLYRKFGFTVEGNRPKFYNGKDAALIMWKRNI